MNVSGDRSGVVDVALNALGLSRTVAVTLPYFSTAALIAARTDLLLTLPARVATCYAGAHGLLIARPPVEIEGFGYRFLWHPRTDRDPASCWLRDQMCGLAGRVAGGKACLRVN